MPVLKAQKMGTADAVKKAAKRGSSDSFIQYIPAEGLTVRFLEEPSEWFGYYEHWHAGSKAYYPCTEQDCVGCEDSDSKRTFRFLANVIDVAEKKVVPLKIPKDLGNRLVVRFEKYGTLLDRDYELMKDGKGLDTTYDVEAGEKRKISNFDQFKALDLSKVLEDAWNYVFGEDDDDDDDEDEAPVKSSVPKSHKRERAEKKASERKFDPADEEDDDDDSFTDDEDDEDDDAWEDDEAEDTEEDVAEEEPEDEFWTEAELLELPLAKLREVAAEYGVTVRKGMKKDDIVRAIMNA